MGEQVSKRVGDWMQTYTGQRFYPLDPRVDEIDIGDIAHALSLQCRYGGHVKHFYSVAEHSVLLARHLADFGPDAAMWALLHDASEAYAADVIRPLKRHLTNYREIEAGLMAAIAERFGLRGTMPDVVKDADDRIIADERAQNLVPIPWDNVPGPALGVVLQFWTPQVAECMFLRTYFEIERERRSEGK